MVMIISARPFMVTISSLPMFIATSRKLQALGLLIAETKVSEQAAGSRTTAIRAIVAQIVPIAGTVILGLYVIVLSSTLLTTFKVFLVLLILATVITLTLRRSFIRVYSKAQFALQETLSQPPLPDDESASDRRMLPLLRNADLRTVTISSNAAAGGKRIRELQLRTQSGASVVGIERDGTSIVNPGPEEELRGGDHILLLGSEEQLAAAERLLKEVES